MRKLHIYLLLVTLVFGLLFGVGMAHFAVLPDVAAELTGEALAIQGYTTSGIVSKSYTIFGAHSHSCAWSDVVEVKAIVFNPDGRTATVSACFKFLPKMPEFIPSDFTVDPAPTPILQMRAAAEYTRRFLFIRLRKGNM